MKIIESWEDQHTNNYAIVKHSKEDQQEYRIKEYEALWIIDAMLNSFGGSLGQSIADFDTIEEAQEFLLKGITLQDMNPDIWLEMVAVSTTR